MLVGELLIQFIQSSYIIHHNVTEIYMNRSISFLFVVLFAQSSIAQAGTIFSFLRESENDGARDYSRSMSYYWDRKVAAGKRRPSRRFIIKLASIAEEAEIEEGPKNSIIAQPLKPYQQLAAASPTHSAPAVVAQPEPSRTSLSAAFLEDNHFPTDCLFLTR